MTANFTIFFFVVFLAAARAGWDWPYIAKLMPVYVAAIPGALLALVQLYRDITGWEKRRGPDEGGLDMDEVSTSKLDKRTEMRRTLAFFSWFIGGALAIWLLGIVIALTALVLLYALVEGREKWWVSLAAGAGAFLLVWGLFEYLLEMRWPAGLLFQ